MEIVTVIRVTHWGQRVEPNAGHRIGCRDNGAWELYRTEGAALYTHTAIYLGHRFAALDGVKHNG